MENQDTINMLIDIYHGARTGIDFVERMLPDCHDDAFRKHLIKTQKDYSYIAEKAGEELKKAGAAVRRKKPGGRLAAAHFLSDLVGNSEKQAAKMVLAGMDMVKKELQENGKKYMHANDSAHRLTEELLKFQASESNIYKKYLN